MTETATNGAAASAAVSPIHPTLDLSTETTGQAVESVILPVRGTISAEGRASFQVREFPGA